MSESSIMGAFYFLWHIRTYFNVLYFSVLLSSNLGDVDWTGPKEQRIRSLGAVNLRR